MPYIAAERRHAFDEYVDAIGDIIETEGEANYVVSRLMNVLLLNSDGKYATHNALIGVLECAKLELYRRNTAPYEDQKIAEHGDLFDHGDWP